MFLSALDFGSKVIKKPFQRDIYILYAIGHSMVSIPLDIVIATDHNPNVINVTSMTENNFQVIS